MFKEKEIKLKVKLKIIIKEIGYRNDVKQMIVAEFKSRNLNAMRVAWVLSENLDLQTLTDSEDDIRFLFLFSFALEKTLKEKGIDIPFNVKDYFTDLEYNNWSGYRESKREESIFPLTLKGVQVISENKIWQTVKNAQELNRWSQANIILYNFSTQRDPKITAFGEQINIEKSKVYEIKERILNNEQYPDPIILNILNNGESRISYDSKNETLTIHEGSVINIVDGFHRKTAIDLALLENPELLFNCQITITFLSEKAAHDYMTQKDKQKPMKRAWIEQKDYSKPENLVIDVIVDDKLSELAKIMKDDDQYIKLNRALTKKSIVAEAIKECYGEELNLSTNIRNIGKWIVEFTDYLMGIYTEEFIINPYTIKETSMVNHKNMFYGYIALSKELQYNRNWKELMKQKIESIDFSKKNQLWKDLGMLSDRDINKSTRNKLYKLFTEGM